MTDRTHSLVVLDMAGTTVADGGLVEQAFSRAAERLGVTPGSADHAAKLQYVRDTMGESKISVFRHLFGAENLAQQANTAFERAYGELVDGGLVAPLPGAREAIEKLRADGRTVVLTTGFARVTQDAILDALGWQGLADLTLCPADAGGRGRPFPDMVLAAFLRTGAADDVRQLAVAGDTSYDMLSGRRSGAGLVAGVLTGAHGHRLRLPLRLPCAPAGRAAARSTRGRAWRRAVRGRPARARRSGRRRRGRRRSGGR
ncbi:HAD family hydrolase [Streptomyces sp. 12297]